MLAKGGDLFPRAEKKYIYIFWLTGMALAHDLIDGHRLLSPVCSEGYFF